MINFLQECFIIVAQTISELKILRPIHRRLSATPKDETRPGPDLIVELDRHIADYTSTYEPEDQYEWTMVLDEIRAFIEADSLVSVLHADTNPIVLSHRLSPLTTPPVEKSPFMTLTLQEILIVGSSSDQVKFSELTMDMFRMIQTLEREPQDDYNHIYDASPAPGRVPYGMPGTKAFMENGERPARRENPHKYLLYKPTLSQVLVFLASGFKELPANGALLLYLSADGCFSTTKYPEDKPSYLQFFGDDFLRLLLLRYVFCDVVLHLHRGFKNRRYRPRCQPPLPDAELLEHPSLQHLVLDLAAHLEVRAHFMDNHEID
ncbi:Protein SCAI [Popillia japonica]|uniref:Protein SCAI n=1 Tax=Popillia japonica TaxID=7064 RepID=A0AAW1JJ23_POPJA